MRINFPDLSEQMEVIAPIEILGVKIENIGEVIKLAEYHYQQMVETSFQEETTPMGNPWPDLAPSTIEKRGQTLGWDRAEGKKLVRTGTLKNAAIGSLEAGIATTVPGTRFAAIEVIAESPKGFNYAAAMQYGGKARNNGVVPPRSYWPLGSVMSAMLRRITEQYLNSFSEKSVQSLQNLGVISENKQFGVNGMNLRSGIATDSLMRDYNSITNKATEDFVSIGAEGWVG